MSSFERAFCCGAVWRSSSATIARELRAQRLGRDILEIGAGSGSVAKQLLSSNPTTSRTSARAMGSPSASSPGFSAT